MAEAASDRQQDGAPLAQGLAVLQTRVDSTESSVAAYLAAHASDWKADMAQHREEMAQHREEWKVEMARHREDWKTGMAQLTTAMREMELRIERGLIVKLGLVVAIIALMFAVAVQLLRSEPPAAPAPIVVYPPSWAAPPAPPPAAAPSRQTAPAEEAEDRTAALGKSAR